MAEDRLHCLELPALQRWIPNNRAGWKRSVCKADDRLLAIAGVIKVHRKDRINVPGRAERLMSCHTAGKPLPASGNDLIITTATCYQYLMAIHGMFASGGGVGDSSAMVGGMAGDGSIRRYR